MPKSQTTPIIEEIPLASLVQNLALAGRSQKEISENAKALKPLMANGWSQSQPGAYFERNGEKHLLAGFTRTKAAMDAGHKTGFFVKVADSAADNRLACIRTNAGKPISPYEQGRVYAAMRDGLPPEMAKVGEEVMDPMKLDDIAKAAGCSRQWVDSCICIFEQPPEIGALIEENKVSAAIVNRSNQLVKDPVKRLKFLNAAVAEAKSDGKETATMKHLDAVRPKFAPLKAATSKVSTELEKEPEALEKSPEERRSQAEDNDNGAIPETAAPIDESPSMFGDQSQPAPNKKRKDALRDRYSEIVEKWGDDNGVDVSPRNRDELVELLVNEQLPY